MSDLRNFLVLLALIASPALAAGTVETASMTALATSMKEAKRSNGFEARMNVSTTVAGASRVLKISVVGQFLAGRERLLIRGISPPEIRNHYVAAERSADGQIRAIEYGENIADGHGEANPFARLFDSELVLWDMFGAWWDWPSQIQRETEKSAARDCTQVRSLVDAVTSPIREVISCVDLDGRLSLTTQLFGNRHMLIRTISVEKTIRKDSGWKAAKRLTITGADGSASEIEVYSGDEHYAVPPETFARLEYALAANK
jgi:hypothetical protein